MTDKLGNNMHITVRKKSFLAALMQARSIVEKKTSVPILANILLDVSTEDTAFFRLVATDLEVSLIKDVPLTRVHAPGKITVNYAKLYQIISVLDPESEINLRFEAETARLVVVSGRSHFELSTLPPDDFPAVQTASLQNTFSLPLSALRKLIARTSFAMSTEETRYYLNGIYFHADEAQCLYAVATDGHRLSRMSVPLPEGAAGMPGVIVSRKTVNTLSSLMGAMLKEGGGTAEGPAGGDSGRPLSVEVRVSGTQIIFVFSGAILISRLVDGTFPDYTRVIPQGNDKEFQVDPQELSVIVERVSTMCTEKTPGIKLTIDSGQVVFKADANDFGCADETLKITYENDPISLGVNHQYIADIAGDLSQAHKDQEDAYATVSFKDEGSPILVSSASDAAILHVLMPMRL